MKFPALAPRSSAKPHEVGPTFLRLTIILLLFSIFYFLFTPHQAGAGFSISSVSAQSKTTPPDTSNPFTIPNTTTDVPKNLHTYTQNVTIEVMSAFSCQLTGIDPTNPNQQCLGVDQKTGKIGFVENGGGAIGVMSHMISVLYTAPLHTADYFNYLASNFGIVKTTHAQGTGFEGLKPLLGPWTAFRNIVYLIFTIVFVVIGLLVMFRVKIDPRTVMTIQNQIPKIIVGIVLVTFSYAIAGFLIDMMYSSIYLIGNVITSASKQSPAVVTRLVQSDNPFSAADDTVGIGNTIGSVGGSTGGFIKTIFDNPIGRIVTGVVFGALGKILGSSLPGFITSFAGIVPGAGTLAGNILTNLFEITTKGIFSWIFAGTFAATGLALAPQIGQAIGTFIAWVIISIAILWSLFKLWFTLIYAYIYILIDVVLAPFWIAGGIIPGQPVTFGGWLRHILSRIAAFPTTIGLFMLGKVFIDAFGTDQKGFVPPLIGNPTDTNALGSIIGLGIILLSSNVVNITTKLFKAPHIDLGRIGQAIGVGVGVPMSTIKTGASSIMASKEWIPGPGGTFRQRKPSEALFGRLFGR